MVPGLVCLDRWLDEDEQRRLVAEIDAAPWSSQLKRRVQHYGHRYDYGNRSVGGAPAPPLPAWAVALARRLHEDGHFDRPPDQVIVNEYLPGQGISAHVDRVPSFGPVVASVSLLSACVMEFTHPEDGTRVPVSLDVGSLCVMTGPARFTWRHSIPARKTDPGPNGRVPRGRRVSVTLRTTL
ncbi:alpha-ketoglutarate-dependent dioxygenase AlkB [Actinomadura sp. NBRC 104412]|uniref:alpha-ketoglutarate-dependent dioxygenase AlkB n=1 Tax=Actinomadura sp. NBRC 104412 TaxID=3032203 RepID=UPI0024A24E82|nr:alpha-ketoglutarate-dependent dioxygenase AlkB [Actinomadura sp. NBRC 104412]GLZ06194.1 alpha-ketoglutarate-dependent dioxygenase AlkB [Actinomadura sp. NBRC 104412]